jgi:hypothetical protein
MSPPARLPIVRKTKPPSVHSFGGLSSFLRVAVADEDSRIFSDSLRQVAVQAEALMAALRRDRRRDVLAPLLMDLLTVLRDHRQLVVGLGLHWRGLYEYAAYLQALNNFRVLIGRWLLAAHPADKELAVTAEQFEQAAWRTLGDGLLLVEVYDQWLELEDEDPRSVAGEPGESRMSRALQWFQKLRR